MRVTCNSVEDFIVSLSIVEHIFDNTIRANITRRPIDGSNWDAARFSVIFQISTVVCKDDGGEYLLEAGIECGTDFEDATPEKEGTERASACLDKVTQYAEKRGWQVLPGVLGL